MGNMHLVTGYQGQEHVTAADHGSLYAAIFGSGNYVLDRGNKLAASVITSNQVRIADGDLVIQGRHVRLNEGQTIDLAIENGAQGQKRNDLIVARYSREASTGVEEANLVVIKGASVSSNPVDPEYNNGDILNDKAESRDFPLYRIPLDGLTVGTPVRLFDVAYLVTLGSNKKIPSEYLPAMNYIPTSQKGAANGVASLDSTGKVPSGQLPSMNYIPTSQKGAASGVAPLNASKAVPIENGGTGATTKRGAMENLYETDLFEYNGSNGLVASCRVRSFRLGNLVFVDVFMGGCSGSSEFEVALKQKSTFSDFPFAFGDYVASAVSAPAISDVTANSCVVVGSSMLWVKVNTSRDISATTDFRVTLWFAVP